MKRKILLSVFVLMLTCLVTFGCVGCEGMNPATLKITGLTAGTPVTVVQTTNSVEAEAAKTAALAAVTEILYDADGNGTFDANTEDKKWTSYADFVKAGGKASGFNIATDPGTYTFTFVYRGVVSAEYSYTVTAPAV